MTPARSRQLGYRWAVGFIACVAVALPLKWVRFPLLDFLTTGAAWLCARQWCYRAAWADGHDKATRSVMTQDHSMVGPPAGNPRDAGTVADTRECGGSQ